MFNFLPSVLKNDKKLKTKGKHFKRNHYIMKHFKKD